MMANNESQEQSRKAYKASKKGKKQTAAAEAAAETQTSEAAMEKQTRKQQKQAQKEERSSTLSKRRRVFPIWLRLIVVLLLAAKAMMIGLMVGYGVLGDGNPLDALRVETWQHIFNIVVGG